MRLSDGFEVWWDGLPEETRTGIDKATARRAYVAGFRRYFATEVKRFEFYAGRRKVTVMAGNLRDAKARAAEMLDQRVAAAGKTPPPAGWNLKLTNSMRV